MRRAALACALAAAACASSGGGSNGSPDAAGGSGDAHGAADDAAHGTDDAAHGTDGGGTTAIPPRACGSPVDIAPTLSHALDLTLYGPYIDPPLMVTGDAAHVVYASTWMTVQHGASQTAASPAALANQVWFTSQVGMSGIATAQFASGSQVLAARWDGAALTAPIAVPCTQPQTYMCLPRAAADGHLWVRTNTDLYEQVGGAFESRGGPPVGASLFDVDAAGNVWVGGPSTTAGEVFQIWELPRGAAGWAKTGSLTTAQLGAAATSIEGGFQLDPLVGTFAPDASIHLLSSSRCIGTGQRNKTQLYLRSRDGQTWDVQTLPDLGTLTDGQVTWGDEAIWASDYDNVQFTDESSTTPIFDGEQYIYPNRQFNAIARCTSASGPAWERIAKVTVPGWTMHGFARYSASGAATLLTTSGITQVYP